MQSGVSPVAIADSFPRQTEAISAYSYLANPAGAAAEAFLNSVYTNLFNRAPDAAGLAYWKGELSAGKPLGRTIIDFISYAQGADKSLVDHNVALAESYVGGLTGVNGGGFSLGARWPTPGPRSTRPSRRPMPFTGRVWAMVLASPFWIVAERWRLIRPA